MSIIGIKAGQFLKQNAMTLETALLVVSITSILLSENATPAADIWLTASLVFAVFFFFFVSTIGHGNHQTTKLSSRIMLIGFSVVFLGILFRFFNYPAVENMLWLGIVFMPVIAVSCIFSHRKNQISNLGQLIVRVTLLAAVGAMLWLLL